MFIWLSCLFGSFDYLAHMLIRLICFFCDLQGRLSEGDQDNVPATGPQHRACSGRVYGGGATVYDSRVHEVWRPQPVPAGPCAGDALGAGCQC